jgi:F-type H+-transporting ATPase subunit beta
MSIPDSAKSCGTVVSVRGSVVDVSFNQRLPAIFSVLRAGEHREIIAEVLEQLDEHRVRAIALTPT